MRGGRERERERAGVGKREARPKSSLLTLSPRGASSLRRQRDKERRDDEFSFVLFLSLFVLAIFLRLPPATEVSRIEREELTTGKKEAKKRKNSCASSEQAIVDFSILSATAPPLQPSVFRPSDPPRASVMIRCILLQNRAGKVSIGGGRRRGNGL